MSTAVVWQRSDAELLADLAALETRLHSTWAEMLSMIAEADSRGIAETVGYRSTVDLVQAVGRVSRGEARGRVTAAADVLPGRGLGGVPVPARLPETAAAVAEHAIGPADVTVIRSILARISTHVDDHQRTDIEVDLRTAAQREGEALVELARRALAAGDLPTEGGERPQVVVTMSLAVLQGRIGAASLALGGPINAEIARRIACDARVIPVVLGARGEPLNIGRASYTVPAAIRRAVIVRDGGCAFPGCSVPARWCDIHHCIHWVDHGPTSVGNCVALCGRHHGLVHHSQWRIDMTSGIPQFHPPSWLGGAPRRNPLHTPRDVIRIRE